MLCRDNIIIIQNKTTKKKFFYLLIVTYFLLGLLIEIIPDDWEDECGLNSDGCSINRGNILVYITVEHSCVYIHV